MKFVKLSRSPVADLRLLATCMSHTGGRLEHRSSRVRLGSNVDIWCSQASLTFMVLSFKFCSEVASIVVWTGPISRPHRSPRLVSCVSLQTACMRSMPKCRGFGVLLLSNEARYQPVLFNVSLRRPVAVQKESSACCSNCLPKKCTQLFRDRSNAPYKFPHI